MCGNRVDELEEQVNQLQATVDGLTDDGAGAVATYSLDYVSRVAGAIKKTKADDVRLRWAEEMPMEFHFERADSDGETMYSGMAFLAPRIGGD